MIAPTRPLAIFTKYGLSVMDIRGTPIYTDSDYPNTGSLIMSIGGGGLSFLFRPPFLFKIGFLFKRGFLFNHS